LTSLCSAKHVPTQCLLSLVSDNHQNMEVLILVTQPVMQRQHFHLVKSLYCQVPFW
jgi:hypothetical protein